MPTLEEIAARNPALAEEIRRASQAQSFNPFFDPAAPQDPEVARQAALAAPEVPTGPGRSPATQPGELFPAARTPAEQAAETAQAQEAAQLGISRLALGGAPGAPGPAGAPRAPMPSTGGITRELGAIRETGAKARESEEAQIRRLGESAESQKDLIRGYQALGEAKAEGELTEAQSRMAAQEQQAVDMQELNTRRKEANDEAQERITSMREEIKTAETDPEGGFYKTKDGKDDTGKRIMAGVAIAFGAMGRAMTGGATNQALQIIEAAINRDVQAQRERIAGKRLDVKMELGMLDAKNRGFDTEADQISAAKIMLWEGARTQMEIVSAGSKSEDVRLKSEAAIAGVDDKIAQESFSIAQNAETKAMKGHQLALQGEGMKANLNFQRAKIQAAAAQGGKQLQASAVQKMADFRGGRKIVGELQKQWNEKVAKGIGSSLTGVSQFLPMTEAAMFNDSATAAAQFIGKKLEGRMTDEDFARIRNMLPHPGDSNMRAQRKFETIQKYVDSMENEAKRTYKEVGFDVAGLEKEPDPEAFITD